MNDWTNVTNDSPCPECGEPEIVDGECLACGAHAPLEGPCCSDSAAGFSCDCSTRRGFTPDRGEINFTRGDR